MKKSLLVIVFMMVAIVSTMAFGEEFTSIGGYNGDDIISRIETISDGSGYVSAGHTRKNYSVSKEDYYVSKIDFEGTVLWETIFGTSGIDKLLSIKETASGEFIVMGNNPSGITLSKISSTGVVVWTKSIGNPKAVGNALALTENGDILVTGALANPSYQDMYLIKANSEGVMLFEKLYADVKGNGSDAGKAIIEASNGNIVITGSVYTTGAFTYVMVADPNGNKIIGKTFPNGHLVNVFEMPDGTFTAVGQVTGIGAGAWDAYLLNVDMNCNKIWEKTFGDVANDYGKAAKLASDGGIILAMETGAGVTMTGASTYVIKTDANGNQQWGRLIGTSGGTIPTTICESGYGYAVAGYTGAYSKTAVGVQYFVAQIDSF